MGIPTLIILLLIFRLPPASLPGSQVFRHTILVATLAAVSFFSLALSLAKLIVNDTCYTGALKVLISLNSDLSSGQGFVFLAVFGLDKAARLFSPIRKLLPFLRPRVCLPGSFWSRQGCQALFPNSQTAAFPPAKGLSSWQFLVSTRLPGSFPQFANCCFSC